MRLLIRVLLALAMLVAAAASQSAAAPRDEVPPNAIAVVAGEAVPRTAFDQQLQRIKRSYALKKRRFPAAGSPAYRAITDQIVALLVWRVEVRQKAKADFGIEITPVQIEHRLGEIRQQWGADERRFRNILKRLGLTLESLRADIRARLTYEAVQARFLARVDVTDDEIAAHYAARIAEYTTPESRVARHILRRTRGGAEAVLRKLRRGARFAPLARRLSLDRATRRHGGVLTVVRGQAAPAFERVVFALRRGQVSRPVKTPAGWHVVQALSNVQPARVAPLAEVYAQIKERLLRSKATELLNAWLEEMNAQYAGKVSYAPGFEP